MRVISQDGKIDIPYENSSLSVFYLKYAEPKRAIICCRNSCLKGEEKIAEYSTTKKAIKAMEMLRERHADNIFCREDIQYKAEMLLDDGLQIVREMMIKYEYFRFPKDDEVKV